MGMKNYVECGLCGAHNEEVFPNSGVISAGWTLNWLNLGYYGGFTDSIPDDRGDVVSMVEYDATPYTVNMCHDCCVKLLATFPKLAEIANIRGGHYSLNGDGIHTTPCCQYAWMVDQNAINIGTYYKATESLGWEIQPSFN